MKKVRLIQFLIELSVKSDLILGHAVNMSQSDFTRNYLHIAIQGKKRKQNKTLAKMHT